MDTLYEQDIMEKTEALAAMREEDERRTDLYLDEESISDEAVIA